MTVVVKKRGSLDTHVQGQGQVKKKDRSGWGFYEPRKPKDCQQPAEARGEVWNRFSLTALRRSQPC